MIHDPETLIKEIVILREISRLRIKENFLNCMHIVFILTIAYLNGGSFFVFFFIFHETNGTRKIELVRQQFDIAIYEIVSFL
jgi:hypothetical protein